MPGESPYLGKAEMSPDTDKCPLRVNSAPEENHHSAGFIFPAITHSEGNLGLPIKTIGGIDYV